MENQLLKEITGIKRNNQIYFYIESFFGHYIYILI